MRAFTGAAIILALCLAALPGLGAQQASQTTKQESQPTTAQPETGAPVKTQALPASVDLNTYTLGPDDVIAVRVWREADLSGTMVVRPDGKITMPLINEVQAGGLTPVKLGEEITKLLTKFVNSPQVMVSVESVRSKRYYMTGDGIVRPGAYPLSTPTTVFDAITMAGGFREFANKKKITILRGDKRLKFNWTEVVKGKNLAQNVELENNDRVVVE
jgi:polysaccharide export outer membrane protein